MNKRKVTLSLLAILLFMVGALTGMAYFGATTWANVEAAFYGFYSYGNQPTGAMHCPHLMAENETGIISVSFHNSSHITAGPMVELQVSAPFQFRTVDQDLTIPPGSTKTVRLRVTSADQDYKHFIFVKLATFRSYPLTEVEQTCGILVLDVVRITGMEITLISIALSLAGMLAGLGLWWGIHHPCRGRSLIVMHELEVLALVVGAGILISFTSIWLLGVMVFALSILIILAVSSNHLMYSR
jgi:hypothetical protein